MPSTPHVILITADELHCETLGSYGCQAIETPGTDRLAGRGIVFEHAYTPSPWCLPTRCSLLLGQYPHNSRAYSNFRDCRPSPGRPNLFGAFGDEGYTTAMIGKCHFAPAPYGETRPDATLPYEAFREYYLSLGIAHLHLQDDKQVSVWFRDDYARELDEAGYLEAYRAAVWDRSLSKVFAFPGPAEWHPDVWVGRKAVEFLGRHDPSDPVFLWLSFSGPHYPFDPPGEYLDRVDMSRVPPRVHQPGELDDPARIHHTSYHGEGGIDGAGLAPGRGCKGYSADYWERLVQHYYANVALIDDWIAQVLQVVESCYGADVLVIFTADHGEMLGHHGLWGKNNCAYEDVWRVPLIVRYPGQSQPQREAALISLMDVPATCLQAAGASLPAQDGQDLRVTLAQGGYCYVLAEGEGYAAIADGRWKYVEACNKRAPGEHRLGDQTYRELYNLETDRHEFCNRIDDPTAAVELAELRGALVNRFVRDMLS